MFPGKWLYMRDRRRGRAKDRYDLEIEPSCGRHMKQFLDQRRNFIPVLDEGRHNLQTMLGRPQAAGV